MSIENIERMAHKEVVARRRGRIQLTGLMLAMAIVLVSLVMAI